MRDSLAPVGTNVETLRDAMEWLVQLGQGKDTIMLDQRGLSFLLPEHHGKIQLGIPPPDELCNKAKRIVYLRAIYQ